MISTLTHTEQCLLCIYSLFNIDATQTGRVRSIVESLTGKPLIDFKATLAGIKKEGYFEELGYNWRNDTYDYSITAEKLIPLMLYFYEQKPQLTISVLDEARGMKPSAVQKMLWQFISSGFQNISIEEINDYEIGEAIECFIPATLDSRFLPLLMVFSATNFHDLFEKTLTKALKNEEVIDTAYLRSVIRGYRFDTIEADISLQHVLCMCDLMDYLMEGKVPANISSTDMYHLIIAGIYEAYHGNMNKAFQHFKNAVTLGNRNGGYYTSTKNYLPFAIANFYYTLTAYKVGTEEGRKRALAIAKSTEAHVTMAAKLLHSILYNTATDKQMRERLNQLYANGGTDRALATLMCRYMGKEFSAYDKP